MPGRQIPQLRAQSTARSWDRIALDAVAIVPSWIFLGMILLAAAAICTTVNIRGRAQLKSAQIQFNRLNSEVETIRKSNAELQLEVRKITTEPALIESAARARLGMVKATEIVVPIQSNVSTNPATVSFVR